MATGSGGPISVAGADAAGFVAARQQSVGRRDRGRGGRLARPTGWQPGQPPDRVAELFDQLHHRHVVFVHAIEPRFIDLHQVEHAAIALPCAADAGDEQVDFRPQAIELGEQIELAGVGQLRRYGIERALGLLQAVGEPGASPGRRCRGDIPFRGSRETLEYAAAKSRGRCGSPCVGGAQARLLSAVVKAVQKFSWAMATRNVSEAGAVTLRRLRVGLHFALSRLLADMNDAG